MVALVFAVVLCRWQEHALHGCEIDVRLLSFVRFEVAVIHREGTGSTRLAI